MKKGIHPEMRLIEVLDSEGESWQVLSALNTKRVVINSSHKTHQAWSQTKTTVVKNNPKAKKMEGFF
jgi:ribosomal protein L31